MMTVIPRAYNWQADNKPISAIQRSIPGGAQCGYTAFAMALSSETATDSWILQLGTWMERPGPVRSFILQRNGLKEAGQRLGAYQSSYVAVLDYMNRNRTFPTDYIVTPTGGTMGRIRQLIDQGYCLMLSTMLAPSGHFIAVIGYEDDDLICHDPAGDVRKGYFNPLGEGVRYNAHVFAAQLTPKGLPWQGGFRYIAVRQRDER